jgi:hypothetical protein
MRTRLRTGTLRSVKQNSVLHIGLKNLKKRTREVEDETQIMEAQLFPTTHVKRTKLTRRPAPPNEECKAVDTEGVHGEEVLDAGIVMKQPEQVEKEEKKEEKQIEPQKPQERQPRTILTADLTEQVKTVKTWSVDNQNWWMNEFKQILNTMLIKKLMEQQQAMWPLPSNISIKHIEARTKWQQLYQKFYCDYLCSEITLHLRYGDRYPFDLNRIFEQAHKVGIHNAQKFVILSFPLPQQEEVSQVPSQLQIISQEPLPPQPAAAKLQPTLITKDEFNALSQLTRFVHPNYQAYLYNQIQILQQSALHDKQATKIYIFNLLKTTVLPHHQASFLASYTAI